MFTLDFRQTIIDDWTASVQGLAGRSRGCRSLAAAATEPSFGSVSRKNHEIQVSGCLLPRGDERPKRELGLRNGKIVSSPTRGSTPKIFLMLMSPNAGETHICVWPYRKNTRLAKAKPVVTKAKSIEIDISICSRKLAKTHC